MSEQDAIALSCDGPNTVSSLERDFRALGVKAGMTLIAHSSLSSLGWVCGESVSVILALERVLTEAGTLVMPAHSGDLSDPKHWCNPPVPSHWVEVIRDEMPCFDVDLTPTRGIGRIPEVFRKQAQVVRSSHPQLSFSAWGKHKEYIVQDHHYDHALNMKSPLGRLYELDGSILLIGVGHENNTSLHLAEHLAQYGSKRIVKNGMPVFEGGVRGWKEYDDIDISSDDFEAIGRSYERDHAVVRGEVGNATCKIISQREIVDFAVQWMEKNRG